MRSCFPSHQFFFLSVFLGTYEAPGVLCVPCPDSAPTAGAPRPQWHCSAWPIVHDPGSGGNSCASFNTSLLGIKTRLMSSSKTAVSTLMQTIQVSFKHPSSVDRLFPHGQVCKHVVILCRWFKTQFSFVVWKLWVNRGDECQTGIPNAEPLYHINVQASLPCLH